MEAACKTLATQRLKRSGMSWGDGVQPILTIRMPTVGNNAILKKTGVLMINANRLAMTCPRVWQKFTKALAKFCLGISSVSKPDHAKAFSGDSTDKMKVASGLMHLFEGKPILVRNAVPFEERHPR